MVDLGINRGINSPDRFEQGLWGSRTLNFYYQYAIRLGKSKFSFNPGAGVSLERFKFINNFTLRDTAEIGEQIERFELVSAARFYATPSKSMLAANYFDVPVEIRFDTNPDDIARSFNVALGARVGVLVSSHTKIKYGEEGDLRKIKDKQSFGLNPMRYGVYARMGIGGFTWFCFYNLSPLFEPERGPNSTQMNTFTAGISINGF